MMKFAPRQKLFASALLLLSSAVLADDYQSHESIISAAEGFLATEASSQNPGKVEVSMNPLDRRLQLGQCSRPLEASMAPGARLRGATSVRVSCQGDAPWSLYVTGKVSVISHILVARRTLRRGEQVSADAVQLVEKDISNLHYGFFRDPEKVLGQQATRALPAGSVLTPGVLKAPLLIRRGDRVTLLAKIGGIEVSMLGEAMNDGSAGQRLRVKALNSKRVVEGQVVSANVVKVTL